MVFSFLLHPKLLESRDHVAQLADCGKYGVLQKYLLCTRINGTLVSVYSRQRQNFGRCREMGVLCRGRTDRLKDGASVPSGALSPPCDNAFRAHATCGISR